MDPLPVVVLRLLDGRVGSTLLMRLLGTSNEIVFERVYPEGEYRYLSWCLRIAGWIATPWNPAIHPGVTEMLFGPDSLGGPIPFNTHLVDRDQLAPKALLGLWGALSDEFRRSNPKARWYAEKLVGPIDLLASSGIPMKVLDCVRDPRDVFCSIRASTKGGEGFGRRAGQSDDEFLDQMTDDHRRRLDQMMATPPTIDRRLYRYEDFAVDLAFVAAELEEWLGLSLDAQEAVSRQDELGHHVTASSPAESIGRWKSELLPEQAARIWDRLGESMARYGYQA